MPKKYDLKNRKELVSEIADLQRQLHQKDVLLEKSRKVELQLRTSESNLKAFMLNARGFGVYSLEIDPSEPYGSKNIFTSPSIADILGIEDPDENANWFENLHPDDLGRITEAHKRSLDGPEPFDETCRMFHQDHGKYRWIRVISTPVYIDELCTNRYNGLVIDVSELKGHEENIQKLCTELTIRVDKGSHLISKTNEAILAEIVQRRRIEEQLRHSNEQLQSYITAIDSIGLGLCVTDTEGRVELINKTLIGWCSGQHRGLYQRASLADSELPHSLENILPPVVGEQHHHLFSADDSTFEIVSTWIENDEGNFSRLELFRDISMEKNLERQNIERVRQKQQLNKLHSLKTMAGAIAHRFNNSLSGVLGNLELLSLSSSLTDKDKTHVTAALTAAKGTATIGSTMLGYLGQQPLNLRKVSLSQQVKLQLASLGGELPTHIHLRLNLPLDPLICEIDATQVREIIRSIVENSMESMEGKEDGKLEISFAKARFSRADFPIFFRSEELKDGLFVSCEIQDNGKGMSAEELSHIFEPFYSTKAVGRGLGLALSGGLMQSHQGAILVHSTQGQGTKVRLLFPATEATEGLGTTTPPCDIMENVSLEGRILLVDDEPLVLLTHKMMLETLGLKVYTASNGLDALELLHEGHLNFCAVLLDIQMPKMNGFETMAAIKELLPTLPILLISGYAEGNIPVTERELRHYEIFLTKPISLDCLKEALSTVFRRAEQNYTPLG